MEPARHPLARFVQELRTRRVTRVALTYIAVAFAGLQGLDVVLAPFGAERLNRWIVIATLAGFPVALVLAWFFDVQRAGGPPPERTTTDPSAPRPRSRRYLVAVAALLVVGLGLFAYRLRATEQTVAPAAEIIAILPFAAAGSDMAELSEGMVQLLSTNLDQVGGLRTLDPTRVLRAWSEGGSRRRSEPEALELGRRLGAGSVLTGDIVAAGDDVRLTSVLRGLNGREIARASVTGPRSDVLLLTDSLSNRLLRAIWRSRSPIPQLRIAAITTSDLDAIRAYLEGERHFRTLHFDSAIVALGRAVELDSTFALAHRRLAESYGWRGDLDSPLRLEEEAAAARLAERLPERERAVAHVYALWQTGEYQAALDTLAGHLSAYPDDAEALELKGELMHHGRRNGALEAEDSAVMAAFEAALRVDPALTPAMIHPVGLSIRMGDSIRFRRYGTRVLGSIVEDEDRAAELIEGAVALFWQDDPDTAYVRSVTLDPALRTFRREAWPLPTLIDLGRDPNPALDALLALPLDQIDTLSLTMLTDGLVGTGRLTDASRALEELRRRAPFTALRLGFTAVAWGLAGPELAPRLWPEAPIPLPPGIEPVWAAPTEAIIDIALGDTAAALRKLDAAAAADSLPAAVEALRRFQLARIDMLRGETPERLRRLEATFEVLEATPGTAVTPPPIFHRVFLAIAHAENPPTRRQGIQELEGLSQAGPPLIPLLHLHLARAFEAEGEVERAKELYAVFMRQTNRAEGPVARMRAEAEAALARLARES
jgi:tetratricopeptide (TPR) repeat protein